MNDFLKKKIQIQTSDHANRGVVFDFVCREIFKNLPIKICEIGCLRSADVNSIYGDGFSSLYWAEYLLQFGGELTIVDISENSINICKEALSDFINKIKINFHIINGVDFLQNNADNFDFIYLDGGDNNDETLKMFEIINRFKTDILIDDYNNGGKADKLKSIFKEDKLFKVGAIHEMALFKKINYNESIKMIQTLQIDREIKNPLLVEEDYKAIDRRNFRIECADFSKRGAVVGEHYPDFIYNRNNDTATWLLVDYGDKNFEIGSLELNYVRELTNRAYRNERSVELALGKWFAEKFNNDIIEIGDVCFQYSFFKDWTVVDIAAAYHKAIRKSVLDVDLTGKNICSISTLEHVGENVYNDGKSDLNLAVEALKKITKESKSYLLTIPIGANRLLENFLKNQTEIRYTFLKRNDFRGEVNNWEQSNDINNFYENYLHFDFGLSYYGNAGAICIITNQKEILM